MTVLSIDCTAKPASVALLKNGKVLGSSYTNVGLTHSETLMPMVDEVLNNTKTTLDTVDYFAINAGPGSFTGVRIGIAALKGLTLFRDACIIPVSTLESMAYRYAGLKDGIYCGAMDARCKQVYTGTFKIENGRVNRLTEDSALPIAELPEILKEFGDDIIFLGDGAELCYKALNSKNPGYSLAPEQLRYQHAEGVAMCAMKKIEEGFKPLKSEKLLPVYLRLPQAERELNNRKNKKK